MPIPDYQSLFSPLLKLAIEGNISRKSATQEMASFFELTQEEQQLRIPSGSSTYIRNRVGWAMTYLTKANLISKVEPLLYRATDSGHKFLSDHPDGFRTSDLRKIEDFQDFHGPRPSHSATVASISSDRDEPAGSTDSEPPNERIEKALVEIDEDLKGRLISVILEKPTEFFERVVLDVLVAMGYGGNRQDAAKHIGGVGDEGIDGRINQDALGLDVVCVQAKRYKIDNPVSRQQVQQFVGAMSGQGVTKGVFITTSRFTAPSDEYVLRGTQQKLVLIDGVKLADLMLRHQIGVRVVQKVNILELDNNYFDDE